MDILELLQAVTLDDVRCIQREATLKLDPSPETGLATAAELAVDGDLALDLHPVSWGQRIEIWFRATLDSDHTRLVAAVAAIYSRESDEEIPGEVRTEFLEKVAVMAVYPYLRADLQHSAADLRLGNLTLAMLRQGEFQLNSAPPESSEPGPDPD